MPNNWSNWVHAICNTKGSWLPGDPRGFRDHDHRAHSSGDYRNPPPTGEHEGLRRLATERSSGMVRLSQQEQRLIARAFSEKLASMEAAVSVLAIDAVHLHTLVRIGLGNAKPLIGRAKQRASYAIRDVRVGSIWAQGCHVVRIKDEGHWKTVRNYILKHELQGAIVIDCQPTDPSQV